ncbi:dTDP-4-amino-4,6-dideoxygalactose transaminase [Spirochaetia bacterium]|nr:dTDP-4-amino-4,6-dideoxygalactose transaminase [Spirochaetia bacterium]
MIQFTQPDITGLEEKNMLDALHHSRLSGDGKYTFLVYEQFKERFGIKNMLLTTSGTSALEMASLLIDINDGDEIIVPAFTFSSTVNAFMLRKAKPVFCDIRRDTLNLDENLLEGMVTKHTRAIYTVDYAGIPCEMDTINQIADKYGLYVIEDAAQAVGSYYKNRPAGTLSEFGCYSFHETKNYIMGEGGGLILNDEKYRERAEIIREKGTNRRQVIDGLADKYTWHDIGSSFLPSDILAALLYSQMQRFDEIMEKRLSIWNAYHKELQSLEDKGKLRRPVVPEFITHNGHAYNIILPSADIRTKLVADLKKQDIMAYICYVPLHSSPMGQKLGYIPEQLPVTEDYGSRALRLPLHTNMTLHDVKYVADIIGDCL